MKNLIILLVCFSAILSCKNETNEVKTLKGDFVFYDGAAVLQTKSDIYGVFITDKTHSLNKLAEKYKKAKTDMVTVEIKGKITTEKDDKILWNNKVEIVEILNVSPSNSGTNNITEIK